MLARTSPILTESQEKNLEVFQLYSVRIDSGFTSGPQASTCLGGLEPNADVGADEHAPIGGARRGFSTASPDLCGCEEESQEYRLPWPGYDGVIPRQLGGRSSRWGVWAMDRGRAK